MAASHVARQGERQLFAEKRAIGSLVRFSLVAAVTGSIAWELINPCLWSTEAWCLAWGSRGAWWPRSSLLDLFVGRRAWCGHLCPVGAFYGLLGEVAVLRVSAVRREQCDDCMDCFAVCPEHHVIKPALKGAEKGSVL